MKTAADNFAPARPRVVASDEIQRMVALYADGKSSNDIGKLIGRDGRLVRTHLKAAGVLRKRADAVRLAAESGKIRSVGVDVNFFEPLTSSGAWVLGLLFGDGHVSSTGNQITLAGTEQVCREVAELIGHGGGPAIPLMKGAQ